MYFKPNKKKIRGRLDRYLSPLLYAVSRASWSVSGGDSSGGDVCGGDVCSDDDGDDDGDSDGGCCGDDCSDGKSEQMRDLQQADQLRKALLMLP